MTPGNTSPTPGSPSTDGATETHPACVLISVFSEPERVGTPSSGVLTSPLGASLSRRGQKTAGEGESSLYGFPDFSPTSGNRIDCRARRWLPLLGARLSRGVGQGDPGSAPRAKNRRRGLEDVRRVQNFSNLPLDEVAEFIRGGAIRSAWS